MDTPVARSADSETSVRDPERQVDTADEDVVKVPETPGALSRLRGFVTALRPAWKALGAYLIYQTMAFAIWVVPILSVFGREHIGTGLQDSRFYQWALEWTPWALSHGVSPLYASSVFAPTGVSMAWSAFVPGPALVAWPITAVFGPLASLNAWLAAAPALAAWAAYLVCNRLTHRFWASFAGGCLFGFSAYMGANIIGFMNLVLIFPIPLLVYLAIRNVEGSLGPVAFVAGFTALLVGLFSISTELFGTATVFGAIAFLGALAFSKEIRRPLLRTGGLMLLSGAIAALLLLPYIHAIFVDAPDKPLRLEHKLIGADLWSFIVPPPQARLGGRTFAATLQRLDAFPVGNGQRYLGIAVIVMLVGFAITERRRMSTWLVIAFIGVVVAVALGPVLRIGDTSHDWPPGRLFTNAPLIGSAVAARLSAYALLAVGIVAALWAASARGRFAWVRWVVVVAAVFSVLPIHLGHASIQKIPAFVSSPQVRDVLRQDDVVFAIPWMKGDEMVWQSASGFWFKLAQGYIGPLPPNLQTGAMAGGLHMRKDSVMPSQDQFVTWIREHGVTAVVVDDRALERYGDL
ncbi:MAG TPA: hypothetical protein VNF25_09955, partial [Actinomycetota bacterium]|nr:hypothetical protein [Actinomycetota bacterium]